MEAYQLDFLFSFLHRDCKSLCVWSRTIRNTAFFEVSCNSPAMINSSRIYSKPVVNERFLVVFWRRSTHGIGFLKVEYQVELTHLSSPARASACSN